MGLEDGGDEESRLGRNSLDVVKQPVKKELRSVAFPIEVIALVL